MFNLEDKKIWVAGHKGLVGQALLRALSHERCQIITVERQHLDLRHQGAVQDWMQAHKPDVVFLAAAKVGGISANASFPAEFLRDNLVIASNIIHASYQTSVQKLLFLGSSCIYPKHSAQPITEEALLTGPLEPTNQWYAIAKIAGLMMCQAYREQYGCDFICAMPTNLYGPYDRFDPATSHVIPSLIYKFHQAKKLRSPTITLWGSGTPKREFLHVDDLASALVMLMRHYSEKEPVNIGCGKDITIKELSSMIASVVGYQGEILFDTAMPDGSPRKLLDISKITALGWRHTIDLEAGIGTTYDWYIKNYEKVA